MQELPCPVGNLLCLSWILDTVPQEYIDPLYVVDWLRETNSIGESLMLSRWLFVRIDSLAVLYELADVMEEIDEVVRFYTQGVLACLDILSDPDVSHSTIELSLTEYGRIASAFLLLKILTQYLRLEGDERMFMDTLQVWQIERMVTLNTFLRGIGHRSGSPLYYLVNEKFWSTESARTASSYIREYCGFYPWRNLLPSLYLTLSTHAGGAPSRGYAAYETFIRRFRSTWFKNDNRSSGILSLLDIDRLAFGADDSVNFGWTLLDELDTNGRLPVSQYLQVFLHLGLFFWDDDRFLHLRLTSIADFHVLLERLAKGLHRAHISVYDSMHHKVGTTKMRENTTPHGHQLRPELVLEWTRNPVQCTFGEWVVGERACFVRQLGLHVDEDLSVLT